MGHSGQIKEARPRLGPAQESSNLSILVLIFLPFCPCHCQLCSQFTVTRLPFSLPTSLLLIAASLLPPPQAHLFLSQVCPSLSLPFDSLAHPPHPLGMDGGLSGSWSFSATCLWLSVTGQL